MINYNKLPERIDIDIKGNIYVQKLPMENRIGLLCPYTEELSTVCNIRCAKCAIVLEDVEVDNPLNNSLDSFRVPKRLPKLVGESHVVMRHTVLNNSIVNSIRIRRIDYIKKFQNDSIHLNR